MSGVPWWKYGCAALAVIGAVASVMSIVGGSNPVLYGVLLAINTSTAIFWTYDIIKERRRHGSNRRTEASSQDPSSLDIAITVGAGTYEAALNRALARRSGSGLATGGVVPTPELGKPEPDPFEPVESDMPILAHRIARLHFDGRKPFASLNEGVRFGLDADATCTRERIWMSYGGRPTHHDHDAPDLACGCGFYALPSDVDPWDEGSDYVTLMVELSGTVIEHAKGYRAGHQRVVECQIPACPFCGRQAAVVVTNEGRMIGVACSSHVPPSLPAGVVLVAVEDVRNIVKVPVTCATASGSEVEG